MANPALPPDPTSNPAVNGSTSQDSLPSPPFYTISGVPNFRTIGGYKSTKYPSHTIRSDLIYRSALPSRVSESGISSLTNDLNVRTIFDLRSSIEIEKMSSSLPLVDIPGIDIVPTPVFPDSAWTNRTTMRESWIQYTDPVDEELGYSKGFLEGYQRVSSCAGPAYATIVRHLLDQAASTATAAAEQGAIVVHCTAGKDRTGVFSALVLDLCGVDHDTIAHEYSLTEVGLGEWREIIVQKLLEEEKYRAPNSSEEEMKKAREAAERMMGAKKENMRAFLRWIAEEHGGPEGWLKGEAGLTVEEVEGLRKLLLVRDA